MKKGLLTLIGLALLTILATSGVNKADKASGINGYTTSGCTCHGSQKGTATMVGMPTKVLKSTKYPFTMVYAPGASYKYFGMDVKASAGTFTAGTGHKVLSGELTHSSALGGTATTSYTYAADNWTSPATLGTVTFSFALEAGSSTSSQSGPYQMGTFTTTVATTTPVDFSTVNARWAGNNNVNFTFTTVNETNASYFEVERSFDNVTFNLVSKINAAGNSSSAKTYNVNDVVTGSSIAYYRIKVIDNNGEVTYSDIVSINIRPKHNFVKTLYPNPVVSGQPVNLQYVALENGAVNVELFNCLGKKMNSLTTNAVVGENDIKFNLGRFVSPGMYYVVVSNGTERIAQLPVSVQ